MKYIVAFLLMAVMPMTWADNDKIASTLRAVSPDIPIAKITPSTMPGMFEVELVGGDTLYASADGNFFLLGQLFQVQGGSFVNLTEAKRNVVRKALLADISASDTINFAAKGEEKAVIHVFTDVDCGYCRKLHSEIEAINGLGISVHYLGYPRAGIGSASHQKLQDAWCAKDPALALTQLKQGDRVASQTCDSKAVEEQYALGQQMGVTGTPAILTADGRLIPGYLPAKRLARELGL
ncbi:MAG TPA: DsbC family protein [Pseudomonadales bacterium]|nr:DsbC family protein [Pseudomonadales bacterium]